MKIVAVLAKIVLGVVVVIAAGSVAMRFADGPIEMVAGGPFTSGERYQGAEPDWQFVRDKVTVEFQLLEPARSRTTWIIEHNGRIYIPCGYMTTTWGKLWKRWPFEAERDGRALLRVDGVVYPRQLQRITAGPELAAVVARIAEKYQVPATVEAVNNGYLWVFEMAPAQS